jgi:hypothetical protein
MQSPAAAQEAEQMPASVRRDVESARAWPREVNGEPCVMRRGDESLVWLADEVSRLTSELSAVRARAEQGEQDSKPEDRAALAYAKRLFQSIAPQCEPASDLLGVITQLDNAIYGLRNPSSTPTESTTRSDSDE